MNLSVVVLAFGVGVLATVNPCGFAMLPALLGNYLHNDEPDDSGGQAVLGRLVRGFGVGTAVSAGFTTVLTVAGLLVAVGLRQLVTAVPWVAIVIGALLVVLGIALATGHNIGLRLGQGSSAPRGRGTGHLMLFGGAYAIASLSCTLGVLLAVVAQATATSGPAGLVLAFAAYAAGAATILTGFTITIALAKATLFDPLRRLMPSATRIGGIMLAVSGAYLIAYWLPTLTGRDSGRRVAGITEGTSSAIADLLDTHPRLVGGLAIALLLTGTTAVLLRQHAGADTKDGPTRVAPGEDTASVHGSHDEQKIEQNG